MVTVLQRASASNPLKGKVEDVANGKIYTADQAFKLGLVDQIDYREAAYAVAAKRAGLTGAKPAIFRVKETPGILELLGAKTGIGPAGASSAGPEVGVEVNGVKVDSSTIYDLLSPRMMYLWNGS